jgi:hypothetical protein
VPIASWVDSKPTTRSAARCVHETSHRLDRQRCVADHAGFVGTLYFSQSFSIDLRRAKNPFAGHAAGGHLRSQ